jgi:hypothetical protein
MGLCHIQHVRVEGKVFIGLKKEVLDDFRESVHHSIIHVEDVTVYQNLISYLYEAEHVSGDTLPIIRSLKLH